MRRSRATSWTPEERRAASASHDAAACGRRASAAHDLRGPSTARPALSVAAPYARRMRPVTDLERRVAPFKVVSDYQPSGDQPAAIEEITKRIHGGEQDVVLLGATGTGKTATVAWVAEQVQRPMLVMQPNKTLAAQFANELRQLFPDNAVEYFVSYYDYYQPEAYVPQTDTYIEKDSSINEEVERLRHSRDQLAADPARRDRGLDGLLHLRPRHPAGVRRPDAAAQGRRGARPRLDPAPARRDPVHPQRHVLHPRHVPGPRRHPRDLPGLRGARGPHRVLRRRDRAADDAAPGHRRGDHRGQGALRLPGHPLRRRPGADGAGDQGHRARARGPARHLREAGQAARGAAAADAHDVRRRDDAPGRLLLRHRELLDAHRRPQPRHRAQLPARLLPRGLPPRRRRVPRRGAADRRHVRGRHVPQAQPGRPRLPAAERDGQPAAALGGVPRPDRPDDLPLRDPGQLRARQGRRRRRHGRADHPADRPDRPRGRRQADQGPDRRPDPRDPRPAPTRTSGSWSPR